MTIDEFEKLPTIALPGLERFAATGYTEVQRLLLPYLSEIKFFWWVCFALVLGFLLFRFFLVPLYHSVSPQLANVRSRLANVRFGRVVHALPLVRRR
jgi:hypothetical protein